MEACNLPQKVASGFVQVTGGMMGAKYVPVFYVGRQVVHGVNHMLICKQTTVTPSRPEHLVELIINSAPTTGEWTLISIEQLV